MRRSSGVTLFVAASVMTFGCDVPRASAPTLSGPWFAVATTPVTATASLTVTNPGTTMVSAGIAHIRGQTQAGPVSGDITGNITVTGRSDVTVATETGTGSGTFTIITAGGNWEGRFAGRFDTGFFSGNIVAQGSGGLAGLSLRGTISQTAPNRVYNLAGTILSHGGS
jgi:hypothetical protein